MNRFRRKYRLALTVALVILAALGILLWIRHTTKAVRLEARDRFFEQYNRQQYVMAELASRTLEDLFANFHRSLDVVVSLFEEKGVTRHRAAEVKEVLKRVYTPFSDALVIDLVVFDRDGMAVAMEPADPYTMSRSFAWREYHRLAREGKLKKKMYISPFMRLEGGRFRGDKALIVAEGIYGKKGEFLGVAIFAVNFDEVLRRSIRSITIGRNGRAWLVDNSNRTVLVDPAGRLAGLSFEQAFLPQWPDLYRMVLGTANGEPGSLRYRYEDPEFPERQVWKLGSYHPVRIENRLWTLGISTPEREVEEQLAAFLGRQEELSASLVVVVFIGAFLVLGLLYNLNRMLAVQVEMRTRDLEEARTRLESTFDELLVTKKVAAVGRLALGLAHEIRNPLSAIQMNMQMIRKRISPSGTLEENFAIVEGEIKRLNRLLKDVLDFARTRPLRLETAELKEIVERPLRLMAERFQELQIKTEVRMESPIEVVCDPEQIHQVLLNLYLNAAEAMAECDTRRLTVAGYISGATAVVKVTDTGRGIKPEKREQLFDPFYTSKVAGGGLGLSILQTIVLRHGGSVWVDSEPGRGATFTVILPLKGPSQQELASHENDSDRG